jgi:nitric oxide reductase NorD protein
MNLSELKKSFRHEIFPGVPDAWEMEEALEAMLQLDSDQQKRLMAYVHVIWPVSHSLCFSYLEYGSEHIRRLGETDLAEWIRQFLHWYETDGLKGARQFMAEVEQNYFGRIAGTAGTYLEEVRAKLLPFIRGVSGSQLDIAAASFAWTDSSTIYLPENINLFANSGDNVRFYTFQTCCQWGYLLLESINPEVGAQYLSGNARNSHNIATVCTIEEYFNTFADNRLAACIYQFLEFSRVYRMLSLELPGLMRAVRPLLQHLVSECNDQTLPKDKGIFYEPMCLLFSSPIISDSSEEQEAGVCSEESLQSRLSRVSEWYKSLSVETIVNDWPRYEIFTGRFQIDKVRDRIERRRVEEKQAFVQQLAKIIASVKKPEVEMSLDNRDLSTEGAEGKNVIVMLSAAQGDNDTSHILKIDNTEIDLPAELLEMISSISQDLGHVPDGYVQAAVGIAGRSTLNGEGSGGEGTLFAGVKDAVLYDEWDFRRQGYRKNWCVLIEKDIQPVRSMFVEDTLVRYRGLLVKLRKQFEMLRTQYRFTRRRRYGDDIDFDALVDAVGDRAAGLAPSERLFIRLLRDERDIAVMFLVDMSNSTEGWVGKAIKESLVLLGDVLEVVGDRYGMYGFSGMRRSKCELYRIKRIDEQYSEQVRQRIGAISPREYTRMAPPIRHLTGQLVNIDARVRLLITITDGKPEDYDDYRGEYAIEDTRQALIEARGKGVTSFCITVDREAHAYLSHMYGNGNYIYVDSVEKLPKRMPEIYRLMTS